MIKRNKYAVTNVKSLSHTTCVCERLPVEKRMHHYPLRGYCRKVSTSGYTQGTTTRPLGMSFHSLTCP